jgi:hypothetical protein
MKNMKHKILSSLGTDKFYDVMEELEHEYDKHRTHTESVIQQIAEDESWSALQRIEINKYLKTRKDK